MNKSKEFYRTKKQDFSSDNFIGACRVFEKKPRIGIFVGSNGMINREETYKMVGEFMKKYYRLKTFSRFTYEKWIDRIIAEYDWIGKITYIKEEYIIGRYENNDIYGLPDTELLDLMFELDTLYCLCVNFSDGDLRKLVLG
jgi:hypothetical protein